MSAFPPGSDRPADIAGGPVGAKRGSPPPKTPPEGSRYFRVRPAKLDDGDTDRAAEITHQVEKAACVGDGGFG